MNVKSGKTVKPRQKPSFWCFFKEVLKGKRNGFYLCKRTGEKYIEQRRHKLNIICYIQIFIIAVVSVFITCIIISIILINDTLEELGAQFQFLGWILFFIIFVINMVTYWFIQYKNTKFVIDDKNA